MTLPVVALLTSASRTCCGVAVGVALSRSAAAPATCGDAIDVPLIVFVAVSLLSQALVMPEPGAKMSRHVPKFENDERLSVFVVAPTVIALAARAGETLQAFWFSLPAATANVTPDAIALLDRRCRARWRRRRRGSCSRPPA